MGKTTTAQKKKEFTSKIIATLSETNDKQGRLLYRMMIVSWNNGSPQLCKQSFWYNDEGEQQPGKLKGFNADDWAVIVKNHKKISKLMKGTE